jgi:hypothetical protein
MDVDDADEADPAGAGIAGSGETQRDRSAAVPNGSGNVDGGRASGCDALPEGECGGQAAGAAFC